MAVLPAVRARSASAVPATRVRVRAVLLGLLLVPPVCWWSLRTEIISGGSELIEASLLAIVVFVLFVLVLVNDLLQRFWPAAALTRAELLVVYIMQTTSVGLAGLGQMQFLNQALAGAYGFVTGGNGWADLIHPHIPKWWVPDPKVLDGFYKGNSTLFTPAHLRGWAMPVLVWSGFVITLLFGFLCLNTMLRRHWIENERLPFPLVQIPLELTREGAAGSLIRRREFWVAFLIACVFRSISGIHVIEPSFPQPQLFNTNGGQLINLAPFITQHPWNQIGYFPLGFHPMIIGITYFLPQTVAFSAWFFYLVVKAENVASAALGWRGGANPAAAEIPYTGEQGAGAFLAIALLALWGARHHLRAVWEKATGRAPGVSDADEALSYRTAVFGFLAAALALVLFLSLGGVPWYAAALFFGLYLLMIVTVTRLRAEAAPMLNYGPDMHPQRMLVDLPGSRAWDAPSLTPLAYMRWFDSDYRTVAMPQQMEALKIAEAEGGASRRWGRWMLLAGAIAVVASFVSVLALYYHYGALTPRGDNSWRVTNGRRPFEILEGWLENPKRADGVRAQWMAVGFLLTAGLNRARTLFFWWPFHPAGFAMAHAGYTMPWVWFPTFIGWSLKALVLRYGGMALYRRAIPFFTGLILGDIMIACLWSILGVLLDTQMYMFFPG